jgi:alkylhydroperoxidase family enzyme
MNESKQGIGNSGAADASALFDRAMQGSAGSAIPAVMSATLSMRPDIYTAVMAAGKPILFEGALPVSVKQMMVMLIASRRDSRFCLDMYKAMLESMGIDKALIESCIDDPEMKLVPPMHRRLLKFALHAAQDPNNVDDPSLQRLRDSGLNEEEILEASMVAAFANFLVTWSDLRAPMEN